MQIQLEELKDEEDSAKDALQQLRNRLDEARATLAEVQQQLQEQGVATPHGGSAEEGAVLQQLVVRRFSGARAGHTLGCSVAEPYLMHGVCTGVSATEHGMQG